MLNNYNTLCLVINLTVRRRFVYLSLTSVLISKYFIKLKFIRYENKIFSYNQFAKRSIGLLSFFPPPILFACFNINCSLPLGIISNYGN